MTLPQLPNITIVSAGLWSPSKTTNLARAIADEVQDRVGGQQTLVEIGPIAADLGATLSREAASVAVRNAITAVEVADVLIAATPVFRGSFTGHFKHLFDLIQQDALRGVPVILAATGGGEKHCMVLEYALRPLFGFFQAFSVPTGVYATEKDFDNALVNSPVVLGRITQAAQEAAHVFWGGQDHLQRSSATGARSYSA
jgi:FMN reductase